MTELFNNRNIKHLKRIFIIVVTIVVAYSMSIGTIQNSVIAADNDYKVVAKAEIVERIHYYADKYNVSFDKMYRVVECETAGTFNPQIQSQVKYNFSSPQRGIVKGEQEKSYGLSQIHLPDHPSVSLRQATDIDFSLNFLAENLSKGKDRWWSCLH